MPEWRLNDISLHERKIARSQERLWTEWSTTATALLSQQVQSPHLYTVMCCHLHPLWIVCNGRGGNHGKLSSLILRFVPSNCIVVCKRQTNITGLAGE